MEDNKENSEIELPKNPIFGHDGAQLLKKAIDRLELPEGFEDNNNNIIPKDNNKIIPKANNSIIPQDNNIAIKTLKIFHKMK